MSYYLEDANGFLSDFATIGQLERYRQTASEPVQMFIQAGRTDQPKVVAAALRTEALTGPGRLLLEAAERAEGFLVITDGAEETDDLKTAAAPTIDDIVDDLLESLEPELEEALTEELEATAEEAYLDELERVRED